MFKGRKVTDPVVQGGGASAYDNKTDLNKAWDTVGKAKSELRKIEHRLDEVERHHVPSMLNQTGETSITDYGPSDMNTTFNVSDQYPSGVLVDKYGRSAYLKSKTQNSRKVSRLEDKYTEDQDEPKETRKKSSSRTQEHKASNTRVKTQSLQPQLQEKKYSNHDNLDQGRSLRNKVLGNRHVEFSDHVHVRGNHNIVNNGYHPDTYEEQSTLTNSRDIRETEINFLNNNLTRNLDVRPIEDQVLTHVSVTVPGSTNQKTAMNSRSGSNRKSGADPKSRFLDLVSESPEMDGRISDASHSDSESGRARKFKGIKNLDPDGLLKIKETIRKQQSKSAAANREDMQGAAAQGDTDPTTQPLPQRHLHDPYEPILPRPQDLIEGAEKAPKVRKIAVGPAAPTYKGFSEAEVKYRLVESKGGKQTDGTRKDKKRQMKRTEPLGTWLTVEETEGKNKKITRVIAPSKKALKQQTQPKNKEIITTSSWRAGQELILRELGPAKKSASKSAKHRDLDLDRDDAYSPYDDRPETQGGDDHIGGGATAAEIQHHKALSEEARRVYSDLHMDDEDGRHGTTSEKERHWKAPTKRKAPKNTDKDTQQQPCAKQRHYDADQVRRYMQRQRADRIRQQKEEESRRREEDEARRRQLEELYNKQKQASASAAAHGGKKEKNRQKQVLEAMQAAGLVTDIGKHTSIVHDRARFMFGEDKENLSEGDGDDMEVSDSSSTLTGDASDPETPTATLLRNKMDIDGTSNSRTLNTKDVLKPSRQKNIDLPEPPSSNTRTFLGDLSIDVNSVTSKFTQALQEKLNTEPRSLSGRFNGLNGDDNYLSDPDRLNDGGARSRAERIQAIKDTAATLQNRLKEEARKIQAQSVNHSEENGASKPSVRWNDTDVRPREREEEFMSRYERVTAANDKFSVFTSNLPGSQPRSVQPEPSGPSAEATKPSKLTSNRVPDKMDDTITETSTFSEITLTDESDSDDLMGRKIGTGLRKTEYHVGSSKSDMASRPLNIPPPTQPVVKTSNSWESPSVDDCNVFSIYSRRQQERIIRPGREPMSKKKPTVSEPDVKPTRSHDQLSAPQPKPRGARSTSPGLGGTRSQPTEPLRTLSPSERTKSQPRFTADTEEEEDTLDEESYTQSFESEEITKHRSVSDKNAAAFSQKSLPSSLKTASAKVSSSAKVLSRKPERMSPDVESSIDEDFSQDEATPRADIPLAAATAISEPPRLSPTTLEQKFYSALNDLETMEMSIKQLTTVDRTRAVAMAQQETVSLAQMLKAKQQAHELQMKEIALKAQAEANESTKQLEDYRKRASESVFTAADEIAKARGEGSTLSETTKKLIESQTEAVKALTDAVKATVPGVEGPRAKPRVGKSREHEETESQANYSMDESLTEDESFFAILPSQSHRKKGKQHHSDNESVTSEASSTRILDHDLHSLFAGEEGFDKFTEEMVRQFMKEEELRAHHQASLLRLRENALLEKTKAELQWLEQQKQHIRNKGADDAYPQIKKRQRGLKMKLQEQQDEIRRLREENKAAAKERQRKLYEEISKRQAARSKAAKVTEGQPGVKGRLARPADVHTEAEFSSFDEGSDADKQRKKSSKSDSEMNTEPKSTARTPRHESVLLERFQKNYLDERNLTQRQSRLMDRRKNAEELLKWKKVLDAEEARIYKLEKKALKVWDHSKDKEASSKKDPSVRDPSVRDPSLRDPSIRDPSARDPSLSTAITSRMETDKPSSKKDTVTTKDSTIKTVSAVSVSHDYDTTAVSENITTARDESLYTSIKEDLPTASVEESSRDKHSTLMNDSSNLKNHNRSGSESSVIEEIQSQSSVEDSKRLNDSSDDTMTHSYNNETFEDTTTQTRTTPRSSNGKKAGAPKSPLDSLKKQMPGLSSPRSPKSLFSHRGQTKTSESESEDSFSDTKSVSELSDFEGRIRALNEELRKRKTEAEKLKRERKRKKKEHMKNKEETLKKQIEAYDSQIKTLRTELRKEINQEPSTVHTVRPQIKKPQVVSPSAKQTKTTPTKPAQAGLDGSEPESAQVSPVSVEDSKSTTPKTPTTSTSKVANSLDRISEGSESVTSRSERTESSSFREKMQSIKDLVSDIDKTEEIEEEVVSEEILEASEASDEKSGIEIDLHSNRDIWEVSVQSRGPEKSEYDYSEDFVTEGPHTQRDKSHLSLHTDIHEDGFSQSKLDTARSTAEISEAISERLPSASASESFVNKLDLNIGRQEKSGANDEESDAENERSSIVGSSRPSSGRSERSQFSSVTYTTEHETSESEKSPGLEKDFEEEDISEPKVNTKTANKYTGDAFDIDDLLGTPEELTPMPSPREDSSRGHSQSSRMSHFFDPLGDFEIGDQVSLTAPSGQRTVGTLLFKGNVQFAPGVWAGVELEEPEGRHDGMEDGVRYFMCKARHGLIVPGHDIQQVIPEEIVDEEKEEVDVRASIDSVNTEDGELLKMIMEADKRVQEFGESPTPSPREPVSAKTNKEILAEKAERITDDLFKRLLTEEVKMMTGNKSGRSSKKGPPVAPKPKSRTPPVPEANGDIDLEEFVKSEKEISDHDQFPDSYVDSEPVAPVAVHPAHIPAPVIRTDHESPSDHTITNMLNDAIGDIFAIRTRKREQAERGESRTQVKEENRESGIFDTEEDDDDSAAVAMLDEVLGRGDEKVQQEAPPRPGSPVPGLHASKDSHKPTSVEESGTFEYDDIWDTPTKAPPPYNDGTLQYKKTSEEVSYAVPHEEHEIKNIVSSAVDEFWEQRRYGEQLADLQPSDAFLKPEPQSGTDIVKKSRLVFKKLLFDLTGEVIRSIYQDDEYDSPVAWHKPKQRRNKFYKGSAPPTTVDVLKPVVQQAVVEILGLNGAKKGLEKPKWGIRKKKDLVDSILVQELREEEPDWVNYDDYELAVKMQLTETIFDDLLTDTVQTMNKIFRKKQIIEEQRKSAV